MFTCSKLALETMEKRCDMFSKLTIKTPETSLIRSGVFAVNFEHISHLLLFLLLTLNKYMLAEKLKYMLAEGF